MSELTPAQEREYWEEQAGWWQEEFTDGADPEYVEQLVPIVVEHLRHSRRVLDVGTGYGILRNDPDMSSATGKLPLKVAEMARDPDRLRKAGRVHDNERDPAHFIDGDLDGKVPGGLSLAALRRTALDLQHQGAVALQVGLAQSTAATSA